MAHPQALEAGIIVSLIGSLTEQPMGWHHGQKQTVHWTNYGSDPESGVSAIFRIKPQVIFCLKAQNPQCRIFNSFNSQPNSTFCPIPSSAFFTLTLTLPNKSKFHIKEANPPNLVVHQNNSYLGKKN